MKIISMYLASIALTIVQACNNSGDKKETHDTPAATTGKDTALIPRVFDKLVGTWVQEDGKSFEIWTKTGEGIYQSKAFVVNGKDTTWNEQAKIYLEVDGWVFENVVSGQNQGKAVKFKTTILEDNTVQFSNPAHDFPTDINYTVVNDKTVNAFIVGPNAKGGKDTIPFNYKRYQ